MVKAIIETIKMALRSMGVMKKCRHDQAFKAGFEDAYECLERAADQYEFEAMLDTRVQDTDYCQGYLAGASEWRAVN